MPPELVRAGRYEIIEELGRGSMGVVYRARDPLIGRTVAVKTLLTDKLSTAQFEEYRTRFRREAQATGILTHPNIVTVYDFGEDQSFLFITMEYLSGRSLEKVMRDEEAPSTEKVINIYEQVTSALDYAHSHRIVHRDIKPANLMLLDNGTVKVADFGIAKIMAAGITADGQVLGTPNYMSPEQIQGKQLDGRSDIFSLGVILYELLTGEKPFAGRNLTTITFKICRQDPIPPRELDATIHPGLSYVITRALAKNPADRYQTCRELLNDLKGYKSVGSAAAGTIVSAAHSSHPAPANPAATVVVSVQEGGARPGIQPGPPVQQRKPPAAGATPAVTAPTAKPGAAHVPAASTHPVQPAAQASAKAVSQGTSTPSRQATGKEASKSGGIPGIWWGAAAAVLVAVLAIGSFVWFRSPGSSGGSAGQTAQPVASAAQPAISVALPTPPPAEEPAPTGSTVTTAPPDSKPEGESGTETADVRVTTDPAGAEVFIDRVSKGESPVHAKVSLGEHVLAIKLDGMRPYSKTFNLRAKATRRFEVTLVPEGSAKGAKAKKAKEAEQPESTADALVKVQVRTIPNGATVLVDGASVGTTPHAFSAAAGRHTLTISKHGYQSIQIGVEWPRGQPVQPIDRTLVPE